MSEVIATLPPELSVVVPTFNERENIRELVTRLAAALEGIAWEVIFVDDNSPDETAARVRAMAQRDPRVRIVQRIGRRGLSTACVEGMLASAAPYLAVMDADLQHDERILPTMLRAVKAGGYDIAVGSRHVVGGSLGDWGEERRFVSQFATRLSRLVLKVGVKDPMSGFFLIRREVLEGAVTDLSGIGFKIMLDIFASSPKPLRFIEVPYEFRTRLAGESKLDSAAVWDYLMMLLDKTLGRYVPIRFIPFALVGGAGVFVHLLVLWLVYDLGGHGFAVGPNRRGHRRHDLQLFRQQRLHLPRPATAWLGPAARLVVLHPRLLGGGRRECRYRHLCLRDPVGWADRLGPLGDRRDHRRGGVELRRDVGLHLE